MSNDTAKIPHKGGKESESAQEMLRLVTQNVTDLIELLRGQQTLLLQRGMNLPSGALDSLRQLRYRLENLASGVTGVQIELKQLRALPETIAYINSTLDITAVLNQVMDTVIRLTGAERGYIMLRNDESGEMEFRVARGIDRAQLDRADFAVSSTIINDVIRTGQPVLTDNAGTDKRYQDQESIVGLQLRSILAAPLKVQETLIGVIYCDNKWLQGLFKEHELNLLRAFSNQAAVAIQNARLFEEARQRLAEITEIRDMMDNIFASIASGLVTLDANANILACNVAAERIMGIAADDVIGLPLSSVMPSLDEHFTRELIRVQESGDKGELTAEPELNGMGRRYWRVKLNPLRNPNGESQGVAIVLDDLTEERERELQLMEVRSYVPFALVEKLRMAELYKVSQREISAIFADVRGFTTFSERLQPEQLMEIINGYLTVASDAINLYDGVLDKYMGDAVIGLFNSQLNPQEDHAIRAVRAALSMIYDVAGLLHEDLPEDQRLEFGIGIHTGLAILGNVGSLDRREFTALGDALELSKLLQENAHGGQVMISEATYTHVKDVFECEPLTPHKTKGRADFTVMYRVVRLKRATGMLSLDDIEI